MTTAERDAAGAEQDNVTDVVGAPQTGTRRQS